MYNAMALFRGKYMTYSLIIVIVMFALFLTTYEIFLQTKSNAKV